MNFISQIRKYKLDDLLSKNARLLNQMFESNKVINEVELVLGNEPFTRIGTISLHPWELSCINWYAIIETSDFAYENIDGQHIKELVNLYKIYDEERSKESIHEESDLRDVYVLMLGLSQHQFWYQQLGEIRAQFNRQVEILETIAKDQGIYNDLDAACVCQVGLSIKQLRMCSVVLFALCLKNTDITNIPIDDNTQNRFPSLSKTNISKTIELYSGSYSYYRKSPLKEDSILAKPIVITSKGTRICSNIYALAKKMADGPFWAIRDHYLGLKSNEFLIAYGQLFEIYLEKLFHTYLEKSKYQRIEKSERKKRADWFLLIGKYRLIIEQKSSQASINIKKLYPDIGYLDKWLEELSRGIVQLNETASDFPSCKITIKILLIADDIKLFDGIVRPLLINKYHDKISDYANLFFMTVEEIEKLVYCVSGSETDGERILSKKLELEMGPPAEKRDFSMLMEDIKNDYLINKINTFEKYIR